MTIQVTGLAGVPAGATAVVLNLTAIDPTAQTYLTVYPGGPPADGLGPQPGRRDGRGQPGGGHAVGQRHRHHLQLLPGTVNVAVDVAGYYEASS